jgi:hypothetical protein
MKKTLFSVTYLDETSSIKSKSIMASNEQEAIANIYNQVEDCVITLSAICID